MLPDFEQQTIGKEFNWQMQVAREIMAENHDVLRAFADLDRTGFCTLGGETFSEADLRKTGAELRAKLRQQATP